MTDRDERPWAGTDSWGRSGSADGLHVAPFRGVRYDVGPDGDPADLTAPPYDVVDPDVARGLRAVPHHIVQVVLPEAQTSQEDRYAHAADTLRAWREDGVLVTDDAPALYVYEQAGPGTLQRGLLAAVGLHPHEDRVVLAHEDTMPGPVEDRLRLMAATRANLEPIFLLYHGGGATAELVEKVVVSEPVVEAHTGDGFTHRLWRVDDPASTTAVQADLAPKQALIADGHHRYATYLRLQEEARAAGHGAGPWDRGLALLVDVEAYPPDVAAIHRVVRGLSLADAVGAARGVFAVRELSSREEGLAALASTTGRHPFLLVSADGCVLLSDPDPAHLTRALPADASESWRGLDATVLHAGLLERLWHVDDAAVHYHHAQETALRAADAGDGLAVLMRPVTVSEVLEVTAAGERMPRKSTSFGPKPRTGLVLRCFDDEPGG